MCYHDTVAELIVLYRQGPAGQARAGTGEAAGRLLPHRGQARGRGRGRGARHGVASEVAGGRDTEYLNTEYMNIYLSIGAGDHDREAGPGPRHQGPGAPRAGPGRLLHQPRPLLRLHVIQVIDTLSFFLLFFLITTDDCYLVLQATDEQGLRRVAAARLGCGHQVLRDEGESYLVLPQLLGNANTK